WLAHCDTACLTSTPPNITTDQYALLALKTHITHAPDDLLANNWSTAASVCSWIGVTCSSRHKRVIVLNISGMGLTGSIPPELGNLSFLLQLDTSTNNFNGNMPQELGYLRRLRFMSFSNNSFSGELPSQLGLLPKLQYLLLANNSFTVILGKVTNK
ncbi:unnamed protein product, partial [Ilex paraguariensis]